MKSITDITDERIELMRYFRSIRDDEETAAFRSFAQLVRYVSDEVHHKYKAGSPFVSDLEQLSEHLLITHFGGQMEEGDQ